MKAAFILGIIIGAISGAVGTVAALDTKMKKYEDNFEKLTELQQDEVERRTVRAYKYGYMDGSNAILHLQSTKTLSIESFSDKQTLDSLRFFNEWNGEKL